MKNEWSPKKRKLLSVGIIVIVIAFSAVLAWFVGRPLVRFMDDPESFRQWVDDKGIWGQAAFIGMIVLQVVVAVIPGEPFEIAAGYAFGYVEGTLLCMLGIVLGSAIIFLLVRRFGRPMVNLFFPDKDIDNLRFLNTSQKLNGVTFLLLAIPGTPKDLLSYVAGLTRMNFWTWLIIVALARIPSVVTSTVCGGAINQQNYVFAIVVFVVTLVISGAGLLLYRIICKKRQEKNKEE